MLEDLPRSVLQTADGILGLTLDLLGLSIPLHLRIADSLACRLLDAADNLLRRPFDPILIHDEIPIPKGWPAAVAESAYRKVVPRGDGGSVGKYLILF
jgi:hypothetical protein